MWTRLVWRRQRRQPPEFQTKPSAASATGHTRTNQSTFLFQQLTVIFCHQITHTRTFVKWLYLQHVTSYIFSNLNKIPSIPDHLEKFPSWLLSGTMGAAQPSTRRCTPPQGGPSRRLASTRSWSSSASTVWGTSARWARGQISSAAPAPQASSCASWGVS